MILCHGEGGMFHATCYYCVKLASQVCYLQCGRRKPLADAIFVLPTKTSEDQREICVPQYNAYSRLPGISGNGEMVR
jgi:hypothetical protein